MSLRPLFLILFVQGIGALAVWLARVPLPDAVLGMLLLFAYLACNKGAAREIEPAADTLLRYLPLFFVPAGVGVMQYGALLARHWLPLAVTLVVSVLATMLVTIGAARLAGRTL
jgi:holin-like protein